MDSFYMIHDSQSKYYRSPFGAVKLGEKIKIYLELEHDAEVFLEVIRFNGSKEKILMFRDSYLSSWKKNFYGACINTENSLGIINYYFSIFKDDKVYYYGNGEEGLGGIGKVYEDNPKAYQITVYKDFKIPNWYKEGIIYQIFVDRFYNGNENFIVNAPKHNSFIYSDWYDDPMYIRDREGNIAKWDFYGGNIKGVIKKLPYIKSLGATIIYFNPIFEAQSCHKYDTGNYEKIDSMFGTEEDFKELCMAANKLGIRIILDGVFSHTGDDSKYFNKYGNYNSLGAYQSPNSPYYNWYKFYDYPNSYECWWGIGNQPNVDELNESYLNYIVKGENAIVAKWLKLGASGWRLDVADELPDQFIKNIKERMNTDFQDTVLIGEVWEDASNKISYSSKREYLFGEELDSVTNYPLRSAIISFVKGEISSKKLSAIIMSLYENYPKEVFFATMNLLGNHDTERIYTALSNNIMELKMAIAIQILLPGVPLIYYGDEVGVVGKSDPDNRRAFPWGRGNCEIADYYREVCAIRNHNNAIKSGEFKIHYINEEVFCFERYLDSRKIILMINSSKVNSNNVNLIEIGALGTYKNLLKPYENYDLNNNLLNVNLLPKECKILIN
ncbi:MAG: glycoside hydrolase family 13 protein [Sarcina sp.]